MKKHNTMGIKLNTGITLVALVVTIVIILILAVISLNLTLGDNGIIKRTTEAKEATVVAEEKEAISLAYAACQADKGISTLITPEQMQQELTNAGKQTTVEGVGSNLSITYTKTDHNYIIDQNGNTSSEDEVADKVIAAGIYGGYNFLYTLNGNGKFKVCQLDTDNIKDNNWIAFDEINAMEIPYKQLIKNSRGNVSGFIDNDDRLYIGKYECSNPDLLTGKTIKLIEDDEVITEDGNVYEAYMDWENPKATLTAMGDVTNSQIKDVNITKIYPYDETTLALDSNGNVYSWGDNYYRKLGNGTNTDSTSPICVSTIPGNALNGVKIVKLFHQNSFVLALDDAGKLYTWGTNYSGCLGDGTTNDSASPICISDVSVNATTLKTSKIVDIYTNNNSVIAVADSGKIYCWGYNYYGQLGDGTSSDRSVPICINDVSSQAMYNKKPKKISLSRDLTVVLTTEGNVYTWGDNYYGQLGNGTTDFSNLPIYISNIEGSSINGNTITDFYSGHDFVIATDGSQKIHGWGENESFVNDGSDNAQSIPICLTEDSNSKLYGLKVGQFITDGLITTDGKFFVYIPVLAS